MTLRAPAVTRVLSVVALAWLCAACDTRYAQTAGPGTTKEAGANGGSGGATACAVNLADRLTLTHIALGVPIRYKRPGYDLIPGDEPMPLSINADATAEVAWLEDAGTRVHVTPLDARLERNGADVVTDGVEVGGLVARPDGFALLTRVTDPGQPLTDPAANETIAMAAVLERYAGGARLWSAALTGTSSIASAAYGTEHDCSGSPLDGRLEFNGSKYGAYFAVHGCTGDAHASYFGDKLVYADDSGAFVPGGWSWKCSIDEGLRLLPERDVFTSLCMAADIPYPGLDLVVEGRPAVQLAAEATDIGYCAGQFGSVVKLADGSYVVAWLSRGIIPSDAGRPSAAKKATDIALIHLAADYTPGPLVWVVEDPEVAQANLHLAAYGPDRVFIAWDNIENLVCNPPTTCFGTYAGTHARLIDADGHFVTPDAVISAAPNAGSDIAVLPNGDLAWAFVADPNRNYANPLPSAGPNSPGLPTKTEVTVARLAYCK